MPIGVIFNVSAVAIGGILGGLIGNKLDTRLKEGIQMIFGICSMGIGISSVILMENLPAVIFSIIIGTAFGLLIHLGDKIDAAANIMQKIVLRFIKNTNSQLPQEEFTSTLVTVIVLFCASGTGIYGAIVSGMTGDHSILIAKAILDIFTALIFACTLGMVVSLIAIPQAVIFMILFVCAGLIYPLTTPAMINDFKACGGLIMLATGFRMVRLKMFPIADMIPAMLIVMPVSWFWTSCMVPLVG